MVKKLNNFSNEEFGKRYIEKYGVKEVEICKKISKEDILYAQGVMECITGVIDHIHHIFGPDDECVDELQLLEVFVDTVCDAFPMVDEGIIFKPILKEVFNNMELDPIGWEDEYKLIKDIIWGGDSDGI